MAAQQQSDMSPLFNLVFRALKSIDQASNVDYRQAVQDLFVSLGRIQEKCLDEKNTLAEKYQEEVHKIAVEIMRNICIFKAAIENTSNMVDWGSKDLSQANRSTLGSMKTGIQVFYDAFSCAETVTTEKVGKDEDYSKLRDYLYYNLDDCVADFNTIVDEYLNSTPQPSYVDTGISQREVLHRLSIAGV